MNAQTPIAIAAAIAALIGSNLAYSAPAVAPQPKAAMIDEFGRPLAITPPPPGGSFDWTPVATPLSDTQIKQHLAALSSWSVFQEYQSFFLLLPNAKQIQITTAGAGFPQDGLPHSLQLYNLPPQGGLNPGLVQVKFETALNGSPPFNGNPALGLDRAKGNLTFVQVSGFGNYLPANLVDVAEGAFINGLVTRMVLGDYYQELNGMAMPDTAQPAVNPLGGTNLPFEAPANWSPNVGFVEQEGAILLNSPIQGDAMLAGWYVGQEAEKNPAMKAEIWALLSNRLGVKSVGESVGYSLTYLTGYGRNLQINFTAGLPLLPSASIPRDQFLLGQLGLDAQQQLNAGVSARVNNTVSTNDATPFVREFYEHILKEQYAIASRSDVSSADNQVILRNYGLFLSGFEAGSLKGAAVVYSDVFHLAYGLGYADGFSNGYAKGFSEGYKTGYRQGWVDANNELSQMRQSGSFLGGFTSFLGNVARVAGPVATVVTTIASLL